MAALLYGILGWFSAKLISSLFVRLFSFFVVGFISVSFVNSFIDDIYAELGNFPGIQVLLLAGVGEAISIIASAIIFRVTIVPAVYRPVT